jgi:hypothetical protein
MEGLSIRECISSAIRYWEPLRVVYNIILAAVVGIYFWVGWPASKLTLTTDSILVLFLLAVLANVAYCAAYLVDIFAQMLYHVECPRHKHACQPRTYSHPLVLAILAASTRLPAPNLLMASER